MNAVMHGYFDQQHEINALEPWKVNPIPADGGQISNLSAYVHYITSNAPTYKLIERYVLFVFFPRSVTVVIHPINMLILL